MTDNNSARSDVPMAPISIGELSDKITILMIKAERIEDPPKLNNVRRELDLLRAVQKDFALDASSLDDLEQALLKVNTQLWDIEDAIRDCERAGDFGTRFIELARSVYRANDRRADLKRQINERFGSVLIEEKSYRPY